MLDLVFYHLCAQLWQRAEGWHPWAHLYQPSHFLGALPFQDGKKGNSCPRAKEWGRQGRARSKQQTVSKGFQVLCGTSVANLLPCR